MAEEMGTGAGKSRVRSEEQGRPQESLGPSKRDLRDVDAVSKKELAARAVAGGLDGPEGEDEMVEWHRSGRPGGELRNERRRPIQRSTTQRSQSRS